MTPVPPMSPPGYPGELRDPYTGSPYPSDPPNWPKLPGFIPPLIDACIPFLMPPPLKAWDWYNKTKTTLPDKNPSPGTSNPMNGEPCSEVWCRNKNGEPKQIRPYGEDGKPQIDTDLDHSHGGLGKPHVHDWGRPAINENRGEGRLPIPGDPGFPK